MKLEVCFLFFFPLPHVSELCFPAWQILFFFFFFRNFFFFNLDIYSDDENGKRFKRQEIFSYLDIFHKNRYLRFHTFRDRFQQFKKIGACVKTREVDETVAYYTEQSKSETKTPVQYITHLYGIQKDGNDDPICETAKQTQA